MKIVVDTIVEHKGGFLIYTQLQDDNGKVLASAACPYHGVGKDEKTIQSVIASLKPKLIKILNREKSLREIKEVLNENLKNIDITEIGG